MNMRCGGGFGGYNQRKMGENVIREEYANSRIWLPEEVCDLFNGKLITEKVESLCIPEDCNFEDDLVNYSNIFKRMQSLKILRVGDGTFFSSNYAITYLPSSLRFIDWLGYPSVSLPESFEPAQLVVLCLRKSCIVELLPISKKLSNLKHLDLSENLGLTKTPNFGDMPNLERLDLKRCVNLEEVHPSLGHCRMLTHLDFTYCPGLTKTPNFGDMPNLESLNLQWCGNLEEVHPSLGHCRMLTYLSLEGCRKLKKLPKFVCLGSLEFLNLNECTSLEEFPKICGDMLRLSELHVGSPWIRSLSSSLSSLRKLRLTDCEILATLPNSLFESQQLEVLMIYGCSGLVKLPISLGVQKKLHWLEIDGCENLMELPSSIQMKYPIELKISNSPKFDTFPEFKGDMHCLTILTLNSTGIREVPSSIANLSGLEALYLEGCEDLVSLPDSLCSLMNLQRLSLGGCKKLEKLPENIGDLQKLFILEASETAISQPPPSITKLGKMTKLNVSGSNISCLPKSINKLSELSHLNIQFCQNLNELPEELPPNLEELFADYHLALKSVRDLVINYLELCSLVISDCGTVSSEQVNVFLQHFRRTCIQWDFHQRSSFLIFFLDQVRIPEFFDYDRFMNQKVISIDLNPSWYADKFMGFWISYGPTRLDTILEATLVCKSDPERKYSLKYRNYHQRSMIEYPFISCIYIPFETLWDGSGNKEGKNPNDYYMLEVSQMHTEEELCWGIRLEYVKEAMSDAKVCS